MQSKFKQNERGLNTNLNYKMRYTQEINHMGMVNLLTIAAAAFSKQYVKLLQSLIQLPEEVQYFNRTYNNLIQIIRNV